MPNVWPDDRLAHKGPRVHETWDGSVRRVVPIWSPHCRVLLLVDCQNLPEASAVAADGMHQEAMLGLSRS
jgi:hypothetical protein